LAYQNAAKLLAAWNAAPSYQDKDNIEQGAINRSLAQDVQFAAMLKINLQMQALVVQLNIKVNQLGSRPSLLRLCLVKSNRTLDSYS
jgi:hypothetical protein